MTPLEGKNIILRALEPSDIDLLFDWENDTSIWPVSNTIVPFSRFILKKYIARSHLDIYQTKQLRLMIDVKMEKGAKTIGTIDLFDFDPFHQRAGIGILIKNKENRQKGYAFEALEILIDYCFNALNLHQLYCNIDVANATSLKLFKKHNFQIIGEKKEWTRYGDKWIGEYMLQLIKE